MRKSIMSTSFRKVFFSLPLIALLCILIAGCNKDDDEPTPSDSDNNTENPSITSTFPTANATGVARNKAVSFNFNTEMDPASINSSTITLKQGETNVTGTVSYSDKTASFRPTESMEAAVIYTATIDGAKSASGASLATNSFSFTTGADFTATQEAINLRSAGDYAILTQTAITNVSTSAITGDMGVSPAATSYITGFALVDATGYATSAQVTGKVYGADMASPTPDNLTTAVNNMVTAYDLAAGRLHPDFLELATGNIGGKTLVPGLYKWTNTVTAPTNLTLSGSADDVWIFQIAGDLDVSSAVNITLAGGAQAENIFWQVAGSVTIGTTAHFEGVILSKTSITLKSEASINGRALAQTAVILNKNEFTAPAN